MIGADYLRPAAVRAGVLAKGDKRRFGWHNFRHSLASFLVASGTDTKTVQELLRHTKVQTTLDLYSQSMSAERMVAQGSMLTAIFGNSMSAEN
jgi:site-specific recombinase XerD